MHKLLLIFLLSLSLMTRSQDSTYRKKYVDSLKTELQINKFKIERIRYRILICNKNPKLKVFFFGWVTRITKPYNK